MKTSRREEEQLVETIREFSPDKQAEVEDLVDSLRLKDAEGELVRASTKLSQHAFEQVWDNSEDADYDSL